MIIEKYTRIFSFLPANTYTFHLDESDSDVVGRVIARDSDESRNGLVRYRVTGGSGAEFFGVDSNTGEIRLKKGAENRLLRPR